MLKRTLVMLAVAGTAQAQVALRGIAYDSLHGRPLSGAFIGITGMTVSTVSDSLGRFVLPDVPKGTHRVVMQHDVLDAIGISAAGARAVVNSEKDSVIVAVPSFATLSRAACGRDLSPATDSGFVFGTVMRSGRAVPLATVAASWLDLYKDSTGAVRQKQKIMEADGDSSGNFALCGVPVSTGLSLRANIGNSFGVWIDIAPLDKERIARRDLAIVAVSPMRFDVPKTSFSGRVRQGSTDTPVADADVLIDNQMVATTNERGEFRVAEVAIGQHNIQVRKIGFSFREESLAFEYGQAMERTLVLSRITTLDSVRVKASPYSPNDEAMRLFEENRKKGIGWFLTRDALEKMRERQMVSILGQLSGTKSRSVQGGLGYILSYRGVKSITECSPPLQDHPEAAALTTKPSRTGAAPPAPCTNGCYPHVFLDGVDISPSEVPNINRFIPDQIEAIEVYTGGAQIPPEYNRLNKSFCGAIILHSRRGKSP